LALGQTCAIKARNQVQPLFPILHVASGLLLPFPWISSGKLAAVDGLPSLGQANVDVSASRIQSIDATH
jgi:hypothetical protein